MIFAFAMMLTAGIMAHSVFAITPTPEIGVIQGKPTTGGVYNDPVTVDGSLPIDKDSPPIISIPISAKMNVATYNVSDLGPAARLFKGAQKFLLTWNQQQNSIPSENNLFISGSTKLCNDKGEIKIQGDNFYKTQPIAELSQLDEGLQSLQFLGHDTLAPDEKGIFNFKREPLELSELPDCNTVNTGTKQEAQSVPVAKKFSLSSIIDILRSLFSGNTAQATAIVASKQLSPYAENMHETSKNIASTYLPSTMDASKGKQHGEVQNELVSGQTVTTRMKHSAATEEHANTVLCSIFPQSKRSAVGLTDEDCKGFAKKESTSCGTIPSISADTACKLCNSGAFAKDPDILTSFEMSTLPNGLPKNAIDVLEAAAQTYQVPAAMLLAIMLNEGSFEHPGIWDWTDANVKKWSQCGEKMPKCEEFAHPVTNAKGPFGFLKSDWEPFKEAVLKLDPNRPKDTLSPCNFVDAAFASAKEIHNDASHLYVDQTRYGMPPDSCLGTRIYKGRDIPMSCSVWTPERVALTEWQYGERICNRTISSAVSIFKKYSCR